MAFNFAPKGWAQCSGQLLSIQQNQALFALFGTYYGGNGVNTFGLPDLRGRAPLSQGQSFDGQSYSIGQTAGTPTMTLNSTQIPQHQHFVQAVNSPGTTDRAINNLLGQSAKTGTDPAAVYTSPANLTSLNAASIQTYGNNIPHENMQPYLAMTYCVAMQGIFPSRG